VEATAQLGQGLAVRYTSGTPGRIGRQGNTDVEVPAHFVLDSDPRRGTYRRDGEERLEK